MLKDQYQVFMRRGDNGEYDLLASDMAIADATLFVKAYFEESYNDEELRFEIRRQPMTKEEDNA